MPSDSGLAVRLGTAQTIAWASTYYLPAVTAEAMAGDLGVPTPAVFAGLSLALLVAALVGPGAGAAIDRWGGRQVLAATNLINAAGLLLLALSQGPVGLFAAWGLLGIAMGAGLYEAAFAAIVRLRGPEARRAITGVTLLAGFASTVGWPLTDWFCSFAGWRGACLGWAFLHLAVALPLHLLLPAPPPLALAAPADGLVVEPAVDHGRRRIAILLAISFAVTWFTSTAMAAHLPRLLVAGGLAPASAMFCAMLVGPAQVAGRLLEFGLLGGVHPLLPARLASLAHTVGGAVFLVVGAPAGAFFSLLHGAGNGVLTISKGTLPLVLLGPAGYGARQGMLMVPARVAQAAAPLVAGLALDAWGVGALGFTMALGGLGAVALLLVPAVSAPASAPGSGSTERAGRTATEPCLRPGAG